MPENTNSQYVTHAEFSQFATTTNKRFDEVLHGIEKLRDTGNKSTNWGWVVGGVTLLMAFIAVYVTPVRNSVEEMGQRLWNIETSRYSVEDGRELRVRMDARDEIISNRLAEHKDKDTELELETARWQGGADRDIVENAHELDLLWQWKFSKDTEDAAVATRLDDLIKIVDSIKTP